MTRQNPLEPTVAAPATGAILGSEAAQMYDLLDCSLRAWSADWTGWFNARGFDDILRANATLASESFSLARLAAARRQGFHGQVTLTLNET